VKKQLVYFSFQAFEQDGTLKVDACMLFNSVHFNETPAFVQFECLVLFTPIVEVFISDPCKLMHYI